MIKPRILVALCALLGSAQLVQAHFVWARFSGNKLVVELAEGPGEAGLDVFADRKDKLTAWTQPRIVPAAALSIVKTGAELPAGETKAVGGSHITWGVMDRAAAGRGIFLLEYFAKAARNLEAASREAGLGVEVYAKAEGPELVITVKKEGKPVKADVAIFAWYNPQTPPAEPATVSTDASGTLRVALPKGSFGIRAHVEEKKGGPVGDQKYDLIRSYSTLCVGEGK